MQARQADIPTLHHCFEETRRLDAETLRAARLRPGSRAACLFASVTASRQLQFATRFSQRHSRQLPRRFGFGTPTPRALGGPGHGPA